MLKPIPITCTGASVEDILKNYIDLLLSTVILFEFLTANAQKRRYPIVT